MEDKSRWKGGSQIGFVMIRWPLSELVITKELITLNTGAMGEYTFRSQDIISIRLHKFLFITTGIRIMHTNAMYNRKIVFLSFDADLVLEEIKKAGFV